MRHIHAQETQKHIFIFAVMDLIKDLLLHRGPALIKYLKSYHFDQCIKLKVNYLDLYYVKSNNWCLYYLSYGYHIRNFLVVFIGIMKLQLQGWTFRFFEFQKFGFVDFCRDRFDEVNLS